MAKKKRIRFSSISSSENKLPLFAFFEDRLAASGEPSARAFEQPVDCLAVHTPSELRRTLKAIEEGGLWWVAALDFELGYLLEPAAAPPGWRTDPARPLARFWRFRTCRQMDPADAELWLAERVGALGADDAVAGIGGLQSGIGEAEYRQAVEGIRSYISAGDCYQVNFTFPLEFTWFGHPLALYRALRPRQPVRYGGILASADQGILSLSPELFLQRQGDRLVTRPMKGTAPLSAGPESLQASEKNRAENLMIVDLLRNDLGRIAANGSVRVDSLFEVEQYPTLWQMVSQVSAQVSGQSLESILEALFPCGSITGAPKIRAMQIAAELEKEPRGLYTGALGWGGPDGDFRLNVAIRTLELAADRSGRLGIGSGIVADSDAGSEWRECLLKSAFLTEFDPGLKLIETLRREEGSYPRLERHLSRLKGSAAWLGFPFDESAVRRALAQQPGEGSWRVRLTLAKTGEIEVAAGELTPEPPGERFARLAPESIDSRHPLRRHKTTVRALYDRALRETAGQPEVFDMVFLNERGEVAEGARSNVFVERDGVLLTPPVASGALPGVLRAELLACGRAREAVLHPDDLAGSFSLGNALRGLVYVRLLAE